jgi:NAD(P)H-dependent FMN reductase
MCTMHGNEYLVVAGSTRPTRRSPAVADWVASLGGEVCEAPFRVIDLRDLGLGLDDEPGIPAAGGDYACAATRRWSDLVMAARGVVFVTPQYNWGYPAPLKNAIDHLYREWRDKPALIVTYGSHGGGKCAAQLREVLGGMRLRLAAAMPALQLSRARIEANDGEIDPARDFADQLEALQGALRELAALASSPQPSRSRE